MSENQPIEIDVATVGQWLKDRPDMVLLDCREPDEAEIARIEGALLVPMSQWSESSAQIEGLRDKHIVVHCHHGGRSLRVAQWMRGNGFPTAQSMAGGIDAWSLEIDPTVPQY